MKRFFISILCTLLSVGTALGGESKTLLDGLRELKAKESKRFYRLRSQMLKAQPHQIEALRDDFREHKSRTDLLDRLIFFTDSHFKGGDERKFLATASLRLANAEAQSPGMTNGKWKFLRFLSDVMSRETDAEIPSCAILEAFMNWATVTTPKSPETFMQQPDYTNGESFETARTIKPEEVGDLKPVTQVKISQLENQELARPQLRPVVLTEQAQIKESEKSPEKPIASE